MPKTLVVGFDGALLDLADRWIDDGRMPALKAIRDDGASGPMRSVFPYNSSIAWTSLSTGMSAGRHGVFDFLLPGRGSYALRVATREDRLVPALWNRVSDAGGRVCVVNIPMTFPAEQVNGVMVSGMDAPRLEERAVHPSDLLPRAKAGRYRIISAAGEEARKGEWDAAERELVGTLEARASFVRELVGRDAFDLVMVNLEATDGAHHYFWQHNDPSHPRHDEALAERFGDAIGRVYEASDRELDRLIDAYRPDTVFVVSDHGGGPSSDWVLFINDWLIEQGFMAVTAGGGGASSFSRRLYGQVRERVPESVRRGLRPLLGKAVDRAKGSALYGDVDWSRTRAYGQLESAVRLNLAGREPEGIVGEGEREQALRELSERAAEATLPDGTPLFSDVLRPEDVYRGDAEGGWDLILERAPGLHVRSRNTTGRPGSIHRLSDLPVYLPSGLHTRVGLVFAAGEAIERRGRVGEADIHQVAPSVLAVLEVSAPQLDAEPFAFVSARAAAPSDMASDAAREAANVTEFTAEEEEEVLSRLRDLGYVD